MTKYFSVALCSLSLVVLMLVGVGTAQEANAVQQAIAKDELVQTQLLAARYSSQIAQAACNSTQEVRQWYALRDKTAKGIEAKYPGYTVDWAKFTVVAKPAAPAPAK